MAEVRGIYYQMVKDVFPHIAEVVPPELAAYFEDIDVSGWYEAKPYLDVLAHLRERVSPYAMSLIGSRMVEVFSERLGTLGVTKPADIVERMPELYRELIRGEGAGTWRAEEFAPGRAVFCETGIPANADLSAGAIKAGLEAVGAYNVRVTVLDEREKGAAANRYLVEWFETTKRRTDV